MTTDQNDILAALNPADMFTLAMDEEIRQEQMPGSLCGFALVLDTPPDVAQLTARIQELVSQFPLILASLQQRGKRFFWSRRAQPPEVFFQHVCPETESEAGFQQTLALNLLNMHQPREQQAPMDFHLISGRKSSLFLLRWLHPFCDARGADLIFKYLCTTEPAARERFNQPPSAALVMLHLAKYRWWQKLQMFWKAKQYIGRLDRYRSIQHARLDQAPQRLNCSTFTFSPEETARIAQQACAAVGLTGISLYYIGCMMRALHRLEPDQPGDAYCVPYAFNLRKQNVLTPLLGNHVGALFAQAPRAVLHSRSALFKHLKQQTTDTLRQQLDYAFLPVMWAASWLSLQKHGAELRYSHQDGSERSSWWFSDIGQIDFAKDGFFGADITGLRHYCQISSPPGLALLVCVYRQQLTLSINFIEPLFDQAWVERLQQLLAEELLAETDCSDSRA